MSGSTEREARFTQAWAANVRETNILRMQTAARLYRLTGDARYADWSVQQLDLYAAQYNRWPLRTENGRGRMFRHGLDEATWSFALLDTARLLQAYASRERQDRWRDGLFFPMAQNLRTVTSPRSNIALWHHAAIAAIAMRYDHGQMLEYALNHREGLRATLAAGLTTDNLWHEGSFSYNNYVIDSLARLLLLAALEGQGPAVADILDDVKRLLLAPIDFRFADGSLPTPSDGAPGARAIDERMHLQLYRVLPSHYGVRRALQTMSWDVLLDPPAADSRASPQLPEVATRNFPAVRMAVLRAGAWQAFVHYGQVTHHHAQEEALVYELHHATTAISQDTGTTAYSSPYHANYFRRAAANNVPLVDGVGQATPAPGEVITFQAEESRLTVVHPRYRPDVSAERSYQVTEEGFLERTTLSTTNIFAKRLGGVFHTACTLSPAAGLTSDTAGKRPPANVTTAYWKDITAFDGSAHWSLKLTCPGSRVYLLQVQGPKDQQVFIAKAPNTPLPASRNLVYYETQALQASFEVRLQELR